MMCPTCGSINPDTAADCSSCHQDLRSPTGGFRDGSAERVDRVVPTFGKILKTDYAVMLCSLVPLVFLVICIAIAWFGSGVVVGGWRHSADHKDHGVVLLVIVVLSAMICFPILYHRLKAIRRVFRQGELVVGRIANVSFFRDRGLIEYLYVFQGETRVSGNVVLKNRRTTAIRQGDEVILVVDPTDPKRAMIRDLYL